MPHHPSTQGTNVSFGFHTLRRSGHNQNWTRPSHTGQHPLPQPQPPAPRAGCSNRTRPHTEKLPPPPAPTKFSTTATARALAQTRCMLHVHKHMAAMLPRCPPLSPGRSAWSTPPLCGRAPPCRLGTVGRWSPPVGHLMGAARGAVGGMLRDEEEAPSRTLQ